MFGHNFVARPRFGRNHRRRTRLRLLNLEAVEERTVPTAGTLDLGFGDDGKVYTDFFGARFDVASGVAVQSDGKIVSVGTFGAGRGVDNFALARHNPDGSLDFGFSSDGRVVTDFGLEDKAFAVAIQPDGKIVVAGEVFGDFGVARYTPDGTLDSSFGGSGLVTTNFGGADTAFALAIQPDGKIVAAGLRLGTFDGAQFALARYHPDGSPDTSFSSDGKLTTTFVEGFRDSARAVALQSDGKIVAVGGTDDKVALARYFSDGSLDPSFGGDGTVATDVPGGPSVFNYASDVVVQPDGKIVVTGPIQSPLFSAFMLLRYRPDGSLDPDFDMDGKVVTDFGTSDPTLADSLLLQPDGKIIAGGKVGTNFALARYLPGGSLDSSFGSGGRVVTPGPSTAPYDLAMQGDGKIVMLATVEGDPPRRDFVMLRYLNDSAGVFFDPVGRKLTIAGTPFDDGLVLSADQLGRIIVLHNGRPIDAIDLSTGQHVVLKTSDVDSIVAPTGAGDDHFELFANVLPGIQVSVTGQAGQDLLTVHTPVKVEPPPPRPVFYDGEALEVMTSDLAEDIMVTGSAEQGVARLGFRVMPSGGQAPLAVIDATGATQFTLDTRGGDDRVRAALEARGLILVPLVANVLGGTGNDQVLIDTQNSVASWSWSALADGGPGNDSLQAMGLTGAMLLGGDGDDQTLGGGGRDVLIGGRGRDMMSAGGEQDLIVPAFTAFDANPDAVRSIHASWNGNHPFLERVEFLSGPSDAPFHLSVGESVFDDGLDNDIADPALDDWLILPCFVTNTNDSGPGSLRDAIICANEAALPGQAAVAFRIPTSDPGFVDVDSAMPGGDSDPDVFVINPVSELSPMDNEHGWGIVLDGRSQARFGGDTNLFGPEIVLDGFSGITEPVIESGLQLFSDDNRVFGLNVQRFADLGIQIEGSRNWVAGNYIGTDATGMIARSNGHGVEVLFADWNCIGTNGDGLADEAERNLISGNGTGVSILLANDNVVAGNFIGTTRDGEHALGNFQGVITSHGLRNRIGTDGNGVADQVERNVISANRTRGVWIVEGSSNIVAGNYIGTDVTGRNDLGNGEAGVEIQSSDSNRIGTDGNRVADEDERNLISGNLLGIDIHEVFGPGARNVVAGNYIGTDVTGTASIENDFVGVFLMGAENRIGTNGDGIADAAEGNLISGNRINGVMIVGAESVRNVLAGNRIGTDVNGTAALGNKQDGVAILGGARSNRIGTNADGAFDAAERNIISGNALRGVHIAGVGTDENRVAGNHIGTDVTGTVDLGNGGHGVLIFESAAGNLIGGTSDAARNIISGNDNDGIRIQNAAIGNRVEGNVIGTDVTGTHALGNNGIESDGVAIVEAPRNVVGGSEPGAGNVISSNTLNGVGLQGSAATDNLVLGNRIGTDATGTKPLGNFGYGVVINVASNNVIGGVGPGERNIISANRAGVFIGSDLLPGESVGNRVLANFIGTDVTGRAPLGNGANGVEIFFRARNNVVDRNVVAGNRENGIVILGPDATNNAVVNNYVGIDADGNAAIGNRNTGVQITGSAHHNLVHSNVLSGNGNAGLDLFAGASNNLVTRNYVGLNVSGTAAIPNKYGVAVQSAAERNTIGTNGDGVDDASEGNVISSNHADGVLIGGGTFNVVAGNTITNNAGYGVHVLDGAVANRIGTDGTNVLADSVEGNHIAGNALDGVRVVGASTVRNSIRGNSIHSNGLLGIDLGGDGVTANDLRDPDTGPNALQNYPSQLTAINGVTGTRVFGLLMSVPGQQFAIDFYASNVADPSGFGEGRRWLGTRFVSTNGVGVAIINHTLDESALPGEFLTATATDKLGNTSEFSRAVRVIGTAASMAPATPTLFVAASAEALPRAVSGAANRLHATGSNRRRLVPMKVADSRRAARGPASGRTVPIEFDTGGWRGSMAANDPASWLGMPDQASSKPGSGNSCGGLSEC